ncbi:MAG TPA: HAMP domain-containing sensor histidine kinase [Longimicrobiaceae bacterium]|nr:HAMP domain-containing sensor histidine kinase [Longimicrobiaceae bacterium]
MINTALAAALAFFALGVTFFGTALLVMFNPRSPAIRWFALFQCAIMAWLGVQGWQMAGGAGSGSRALNTAGLSAVHMAPTLFLGFAFATAGRSWRLAIAAIAAGAALLPMTLQRGPYGTPLLMLWNIGAWIAATAALTRWQRNSYGATARDRRLAVAVTVLMTMVLPVGVLGGLLGIRGIGVYVMPVLMVWIQCLIFVGVTRLRFYDIEVRAARTGDLAAAAAEQERLAVVGELAASLAHEIRNPLTGVRSLAQRLAEEEIDGPRRVRYAGVILEEVGRVERLVTNLLGIARRPARQRSGGAVTPLGPLFDDLLLLVSARAERARIRLTADGGGLSAQADREPLAQALLNLLLNALAHTPEGGTVTLRAVAADGGATEIAVRDSGPGVAAEDRGRIWEPFHSGSGGTGLGLAVVRRICKEEGWQPDLLDPPGGGAEFRLRIAPREAGL